ncbi:hypothetical protein F8S13_11590 [Chloroflexia bacterium SDU3-3]|nr:hypothetical protein F8S13_11590 [Chloroflexia bacterium SDU3-3]
MGTSTSYTAPTGGGWPSAKRQATRFARTAGAAGGQVSPIQVIAAYIRAHGGADSAASSAVAAQGAIQRLGSFISQFVRGGLAEALASVGLAHLVGRDAGVVLEELVDWLAGPSGTLDESIAHTAMLTLLARELPSLDVLADLDVAGVERMLGTLLIEYVYQRMVVELGVHLQNGALTAAEAVRAERDLYSYIIADVEFEFQFVGVNSVVWAGPEGQEIVKRLLESAYAQLAAVTV